MSKNDYIVNNAMLVTKIGHLQITVYNLAVNCRFLCRCKRPVLRRDDPLLCAQCASPIHLSGQEVAEVSHDNITCSPPIIIDQEPFSSTELFLDDPELMEMQNGILNFNCMKYKWQ